MGCPQSISQVRLDVRQAGGVGECCRPRHDARMVLDIQGIRGYQGLLELGEGEALYLPSGCPPDVLLPDLENNENEVKIEEVKEEEEDEKKEKPKKKIKVLEWELLNHQRPIWIKKKDEIKEFMNPYIKKLDERKEKWKKEVEKFPSYHDFLLENYYK